MASVYLSSQDAAGVLGVKSPISASRVLRDWGVINQSRSGTSNSYLAEDVVKVAFERQRIALARHRNDSAAYAREIIAQLRPPAPETVTLVDGRKVPRDTGADLASVGAVRNKTDPFVMLGPDAPMVFGPGVIKAAAADLKPGLCRYCYAKIQTPHGGIGPDLSEACRILLGDPCLRCLVDLAPPKRPAAVSRPSGGRSVDSSRSGRNGAQTARTGPHAPVLASAGPDSAVYYRSQAENCLKLADQARERGEFTESRRLRDKAAAYTRKAAQR